MRPFARRQPARLLIDETYGDPGTRALVAALSNRNWQAARDVLAPVTDPDDLAYLIESAGDVDGVQEWIGEWVHAEPESTLPLLVKGCHAVHWARKARGSEVASRTGQEQFDERSRRLRIAESTLDEVRSEPVRAELLAAAERSVLHPSFTPHRGWAPRANTFAMALGWADLHDAAARVFDMLGDNASRWPWRYGHGDDPAGVFLRAREHAYANRAS